MSSSIELGVQSYCFRHFRDNTVVAEKVQALGLKQIELCGIHADFSKPAEFGDVVSIYRKAGISITSLGVLTFNGEPYEKAWFECAAVAGAKHISCHFKIDTFLTAIPRVRAWAREFGVRVGIHCHGGYLFGCSPDELEYLTNLGGPEIGVWIDTAWAMQIGPHKGNPVEWAKQFKGRIYGVHFKDFVFERNASWKDVIVGTGNLDLPAFTKALIEGGFNGAAIVEYEGNVENPDPELKRCVEAMRKVV